MADQAKLDKLIKLRGIIRTKITKQFTNFSDNFAHWSTSEINLNLMKCRGLNDEVVNLDRDVLSLMLDLDTSEDYLSKNTDECERYSDMLLNMISKLENPPNADSTTPAANVSPNFSFNPQNRVVGLKLPPVELPKYSHKKGENLGKFFKIFDSIISKHPSLSDHQHFLLLQQQLSGPPRILVDTLDFDLQKYTEAKAALIAAFDSSEKSKDDIIDMLAKLKLDDREEPYAYIGKVRTILSSIDNLKINVDDFARHFIWKGLNRDFQSHLTNITNKFMPSLDDIRNKLFEAADRYNHQISDSKPNVEKNRNSKIKETASHAVNIEHKSKTFCGLCKFDKKPQEHHISKCPVYLDAKAKAAKLRKVDGCIKCGFVNHNSSKCKLKFQSKCRNCQGEHFTFLCFKDAKKPGNTTANEVSVEDDEASISSCIATYTISAENSVILPTFTAHVKTDDDSFAPLRIFKDGGSQRSFIDRSLADFYGFPVVKDNVLMTVRGFNSSKQIKTRIVKMTIKIGENIFTHDVICVDRIRTQFNVNGMGKIVSKFVKCGYQIADNEYNDETTGKVDLLDMIFGSDTDHMFPMKFRNFGDPSDLDSNSSFIETPHGVIFSGNIRKMLDNLKFLPNSNETISTNFASVSMSSSDSKSASSSMFPPFLKENKNVIPYEDIQNPVYDSHFIAVTSMHSILSDTKADSDFCFSPDIPMKMLSELKENELNAVCEETLNFDSGDDLETETGTNLELVDYALNNAEYDDGHVKMPILWNNKCSHLLSKNFHLASKLLESNFDKLSRDKMKLKMYDDTFRQQEELGIIERINNLDSFLLEHPEASFLCHMGVFRMTHESTRCRIVFLSNLAERFKGGLSHNSCMLPGPNLNVKISTAILVSRFNRFMLTFDIRKAFLAIKLFERDAVRLCFLWYNLDKNMNRTEKIAYKSVRLPFGLRNSPTLLMLSLFKILMLDNMGDPQIDAIKRELWNGVYMDNLLFSCNDEKILFDSYEIIKNIFEQHKMFLQQFYTNCESFQNFIDKDLDIDTPQSVKFFGMTWRRTSDTLSVKPIHLDSAADTKRKVLSALNGVYDLFGIYAPILLKSKLFLQQLLVGSKENWDVKLSADLQAEWNSICRSVNATPVIEIERFVGSRDSNFTLVAMSDASKDAIGVVVYIKDLKTGKVSFLTAKCRLVSITAPKKSIPTLEFQALAYGVEILYDLFQELTGPDTVIPIKISSCFLYVDSMVCIHWLNKYSILFEKLQSLSVFVKNRLRYVNEICAKMPVTFRHISGEANPSDLVTRCTTYRALSKSNYFSGPDFLTENLEADSTDISVKLPNPICRNESEVSDEIVSDQVTTTVVSGPGGPSDSDRFVLDINRFSSFNKAVNTLAYVLLFIKKLKDKVCSRVGDEAVLGSGSNSFLECRVVAHNYIICSAQREAYREVFEYLDCPSKHTKDIPGPMNRYNLYRDGSDCLRIKSKFQKQSNFNPILLPKSGVVTASIIRQAHENVGHLGLYTVLRELRKNYWIECCISAVKRCLKACLVCRRLNEKPIKINQGSYRQFRCSPPQRCFRSIFVDHIGPIFINLQGVRTKVWLLIISCLFSRAVNLKICRSLSVQEFLRALQLHCNEYGQFSEFLSDLGSSLVAGTNSIKAFLSDHETQRYLGMHGVKEVKFQQYAKGNSSLGSIVECQVKQVKFLIQKSIKSNVLDYFDFETLISEAVSLINKRPVSFREDLSSLGADELPQSITPEMLLRGYDSPTVNLIPQLQPIEDDWTPQASSLSSEYDKLRRVRENMVKVYHEDFMVKLIAQAVDKPELYKPVLHKKIRAGDVVLLVDQHLKQYQYPTGRVLSVEYNSLGESTSAKILKGDTREIVNRHVTSLILFIPGENCTESAADCTRTNSTTPQTLEADSIIRPKSKRTAAKVARKRCMKQLSTN